jgi:hypothetical protein
VFAETLNTRLLTALDRPDLRVVADGRAPVRDILFDATLDTAFRVDPDGRLVLGAACLGEDRVCAFHLRHALELSVLLTVAGRLDEAGPDLTMLAGFCAARVAARFWLLDASPDGQSASPEPASWLSAMAGDQVPDLPILRMVWNRIRAVQASSGCTAEPTARTVERLMSCWALLGPAETLMAEGGDARLAVDPHTGLNHYGCSHRPRPWAITFASSTASSLSERGFGGAEAARKRIAAACLSGTGLLAAARETEAVRGAISAHYGLPDDAAIVLAASGTDLEMAALALCCLDAPDGTAARPVSNVLLAPEETGAGVPLAASGRHFAADTARGRPVEKGALIDGFPANTRLLPVAIRDQAGRLLPIGAVDSTCASLVEAEAAAGRTVLLHRLDLSKTGLLAPGLDCIDTLQIRLGGRLEVVVDACQARLDRTRVLDYVARGWMVMLTGSKFFTGPPFCGALLLPARIARRLHGRARLPRGLGDYVGAGDWPAGAIVAPGDPGINLGMILRWQAALGEMQAFAQVPDTLARDKATRFIDGVEAAIADSPDVAAVTVPDPDRATPETGPCWDQLQTIRSFLVLAPAGDPNEPRLPLEMAPARLVYRWLNADVSRALRDDATDQDRSLARLLCHIGQPAPVADDRLPTMAGALRISVGARLLSGEPSHEGLDSHARIAREIADVRRILAKIGLLLGVWPALLRLDPVPRFSSDAPLRRRADPGLNI